MTQDHYEIAVRVLTGQPADPAPLWVVVVMLAVVIVLLLLLGCLDRKR